MRIPLRRTGGPSISGKIHKQWMKEANRGYTPEEMKKWYPAPRITEQMSAEEVRSVRLGYQEALKFTLPVKAFTRIMDKRTPMAALGKAE